MKKILFALALCSIVLSSCEDFFSQTVEIDPPPYDKQLSFHLLLTNEDSALRMVLSRNYGILETVPTSEDFYVKGGSASLYKDGQPWLSLQALSPDSSFVLVGVLPAPLQSGSTYEIRAEHPDYPMAHAEQTMPGDMVVDSARVKRNAVSGQFGDKYDVIDVFMKDPQGIRNYYEVRIETRYYELGYNPNTNTYDTLGVFETPIYPEEFPDPNVAFGFKGGGLLSDQFFEGQAYKFQVRVYNNGDSEYIVRVRNITEEYYRWSRSYQAKEDAEDNPLVEPVSVFNNLIDGLGIFSVAREKAYVIK